MIWSSSQTSLYNNVDLNDIQDAAGLVSVCVCVCVRVCVCMCARTHAHVHVCVIGTVRRDPYGVSKKTIDLTAIQLNKELSEKVNNYSTYNPHLRGSCSNGAVNGLSMFILPSGYLLSCCKSRNVCQSDDKTDVAMVGVVSHSAYTDVGMSCDLVYIILDHVMCHTGPTTAYSHYNIHTLCSRRIIGMSLCSSK